MNPDLWLHLLALADEFGVDLRVVEGPNPEVTGISKPGVAAICNWRSDDASYWVALHELAHSACGHFTRVPSSPKDEEEREAWRWAREHSLVPAPQEIQWSDYWAEASCPA